MLNRAIPDVTCDEIQAALVEYKKLKFYRISKEMKELAKLQPGTYNGVLTAYGLYHLLRIITAIDPAKSPKSFAAVAGIIQKFHENDIAAVKAHVNDDPVYLQYSFETVLTQPAECAIHIAFCHTLLSQFTKSSDKFFAVKQKEVFLARGLIVDCMHELSRNNAFPAQMYMAYQKYSRAAEIEQNPQLIIELLTPLFVNAKNSEEKYEQSDIHLPVFHENPEEKAPASYFPSLKSVR
jgi:hypothetical protein